MMRPFSLFIEDIAIIQKKTFEGRSNKEKIIIDGGCGGPGRVLEIQKQYPNAQVVYDKNTAEGVVNQYEAYKILRRVTLGQTDWDNVRDKTEIERGIVLPNDKNQLFLTYKKRLLRTPPKLLLLPFILGK